MQVKTGRPVFKTSKKPYSTIFVHSHSHTGGLLDPQHNAIPAGTLTPRPPSLRPRAPNRANAQGLFFYFLFFIFFYLQTRRMTPTPSCWAGNGTS
jgi:hypothetical protein